MITDTTHICLSAGVRDLTPRMAAPPPVHLEISALAPAIPKAFKGEVEKMAEIDADARQALIAALDSTPPAASLPQLEAHLVAKTDISQKHAQSTISVATSIARSSRRAKAAGDDAVEFTTGIARAAANDGLLGSLEDHVIEDFARFLLDLVKHESVFISATKITALLYEQDKIYQDAKVITDFRPLFDGDADELTHLHAGVIFHTLRLATTSLTRERLHIYIALDTEDLISLRDALTRALAKDKLLRKSLSAIDIPIHD